MTRVLRSMDSKPRWQTRTEVFQLIRYGACGLFCTSVYVVTTHALHEHVQVSLSLAASISFILASAISYALQYSWTFRSSRKHFSAIPRYIVTLTCALAINYVIVALADRWLPSMQSLFVGIIFVIIWNYVASRMWVFVFRHGST